MNVLISEPAPVVRSYRQHRLFHRNGNSPRESTREKSEGRLRFAIAANADRDAIYRLRHDVYARELGQHRVNAASRLRDALDDSNTYIVATIDEEIVGFVSVTSPGKAGYSIDKYFERERLPFAFDERLYEVRLLTVLEPWRGRPVAALLMYAAFRWIEARGGTRIVAIGRREIVPLYLRIGLEPVGFAVESGAVTFDVLQAGVAGLRTKLREFAELLRKLESEIAWELHVPFHKPSPCFHGGAFFERIGERFDSLEKRHAVINADVLDAWFPPSPRVVSALTTHLEWLLRTSPPTGCVGLIDAIAEARGVPRECVLPGAGSSDLIFLALRQWLKPSSRALLLDPTYGEYAHLLERVVGCQVDRLTLRRKNDYRVPLDELTAQLGRNYDLVVLVNPNSPTGQHMPAESFKDILRRVPPRTRVWVDETYVEYAGAGQSLERFAVGTENVIVCKSMSKVYALSGARSAYLCAAPHQLEELRSITPPWAVGLPAQVAAVTALQDPDYYAQRYEETHRLREALADGLRGLGLGVVPGCANFLLSHLPEAGPTAGVVVARCQEHGLCLRDASGMGSQLGRHALRLAVKDAATNSRMLAILEAVLKSA